MTAIDDLSTSLNSLSLNSSTAPLTLTSTFTLVCGDGGTVSVEAALLSSASSVFRDMLEAGSGALECEVSESKGKIEMLIRALKEGEAPSGEKNWMALRRMQDKYDVPSLKAVLLCEGWRMQSKSPYFAYAVGSILDDRGLMRFAAEQALEKDYWHDRGALFRALPKKETDRLIDYRDAHIEQMVKILDRVPLGKSCECSDGRAYRNTVEGIWDVTIEQAKKRLQPTSDLVRVVSREVDSRSQRVRKCDSCRARLDRILVELERRWGRNSHISLF
ncbi:hypothetical protein JCM6882_002492 [Rhodosporidiobolus microsporus]